MGFSVAGISVITRCASNIAQDGFIREVRYDSQDAFCLDGQRLVQVGGTTSSTEYRTFPDTFAKVVAHSPKLYGGPTHFEVYTKSGLILEFGGTDSGRMMARAGVTRAWWITKANDRNGNSIAYKYNFEKDAATGHSIDHVPGRIDYTSHPNAPSSQAVIFEYDTKHQKDIRTLYNGGMALTSSRRLKKVKMLAQGKTVREYQFIYGLGPGTQRTILKELRECGADSVCKPPTQFMWSGSLASLAETTSAAQSPISPLGSVMLMDVTGDGLDEIVTSDLDEVIVADGQAMMNWHIAPNALADEAQEFKASKLAYNEPELLGGRPELGSPIDYDQDGRMDIFLHDVLGYYQNWQILLATPDGKFKRLDTGIQRPQGLTTTRTGLISHEASAHLADVTGDGIPDLIQCRRNPLFEWSVHPWVPERAGFSESAEPIPVLEAYSCDAQVQTVDVNADGMVEILLPGGLRDDSGGYIAFNHYAAVGLDKGTWKVSSTNLPVPPSGGSVFFLDVNGDGLPDAVESGYQNQRLYTFLNTGDGFASPIVSVPPLSGSGVNEGLWTSVAASLDYNGDGRQDLLIPIQLYDIPVWRVLLATNDGTFDVVNPGIPFDSLALQDAPISIADPHGPRIADVDGDGVQDIVLPSGRNFHVFKATSGEQDILSSITDGLNSLVPGDPGYTPNVSIRYSRLIDYAMTEGHGHVKNTYTYLSSYDKSNECNYPRRCVVGPRRVTSSYVLNNGANGERHFRVFYRDGRYHRLGRGWLGFGQKIVSDIDTGAGSIQFFDNVHFDPILYTYSYAGQVVREWRWNPGVPNQPYPELLEMIFTDIDLQVVRTQGLTNYFTTLSSRRERRQQSVFNTPSHDWQIMDQVRLIEGLEADPWVQYVSDTQRDIRAVDDYGNILDEGETVEDIDAQQNTTREFLNDEDNWLIGRMTGSKECATSDQTEQCRELSRTYDSKGRVITERMVAADDPESRLDVSFVYDIFGNITSTKGRNAWGDERASCTSYDIEGFFPYAQRNAEGHLSYMNFDRGLGVQTAVADPNGLVTQWARDGLGRISDEVRADGTKTNYSLTRTKDGGATKNEWNVKLRTKVQGGDDTTVQYDSLGRVVRWWTQGLDPCEGDTCTSPAPIMQEIVFDELGEHVARRSVPTSMDTPPSARRYDKYTYDCLGRVVVHESPWGAITRTDYWDRKVQVTGPSGAFRRLINDPLGRPQRTIDAEGGETRYSYGPFGTLLEVIDPGGAVTRTERDPYGRVRKTIDPDRGTTISSYDGFGDLIRSKDQAGRTVDWSYDRLGRTQRRIDKDSDGLVEVTRWDWDKAANGVGRLAKVTSPAGATEERSYDTLGRLKSVRSAYSDVTMASEISYDKYSRPSKITYPKGPSGAPPFVTRQVYDAFGHLIAVTDNATNTPFWRVNQVDEAGRIREERFGDGTTTTRSYFDDKDRTKTIQTITSQNVQVQSLSYEYDDRLNLKSRHDKLHTVVEQFEYDKLDRLKCASFLGAPCSQSFDYAPNGNIVSKSDIGSYTYDPSHPHAVRKAGSKQYKYDAVGNQTFRSGVWVTYTPFDLPKQFKYVGDDFWVYFDGITIQYDGNQRRLSKTTPDTNTYYFGGLFERLTHLNTGDVEYKYFVRSSERVIGVVTRQQGAPDATQYMHVDGLGSVDAVTVKPGTSGAPASGIIERRSYDAFGARRNPIWSDPTPSSFLPRTTRGFTGHEDDDELGLVNMKGRIYDPKLGRFLTPDPIISKPHFSQSWNRYSYALNSPLSYVDPSGFQEETQAELIGVPRDPDGGYTVWVFGTPRSVSVNQSVNADALGYGAACAPTDTDTIGTVSGYVAQPVVSATPLSTMQIVGEVASGAGDTFTEMAVDGAKIAALGPLVGQATMYSMIYAIVRGYQDGGVVGAINSINPLYHLAEAGAATYLAVDAEDYRAAGAAWTKAGVLVATAIVAGRFGPAGAAEGVAARVEIGAAGGRGARFITNPAGTTLDLRTFQGLTRNPGTIAAGRSGAGRALTGPANSFSVTEGGHALVYGPEGRLMYDVSASRIKAFQWNQAPNGQWFSRTGSDLKFPEVPQSVLDVLGL